MDRRTLIVAGLASLGAGRALAQPSGSDDPGALSAPEPIRNPGAEPPAQAYEAAPAHQPAYPTDGPTRPAPAAGPGRGPQDAPPNGSMGGPRAKTYSRDELVGNLSDFLGVTAEAAGGAIEKIFNQNQDRRPTAYIAGEEGSAAIFAGVRYGRGLLYMKDRQPFEVFWQGPSIGWDLGGNASRVFTLCYDLDYPETIFQRFPGVEGSAYLVGGLGVNYQTAQGITLAPIRAGVGVRLGANIGYLSYTRQRNPLPF